MALKYDLTAIKNHETVCFEGEKLNPVTNTIIFYMMIVDLPAITEQNVAEVYSRIAIYERLTSHLSNNGADITLADVVAHIGLKTNTSNASRAEWLKRVKDWVKRDLDEIHARAIKELAEQKVPA
jgi:hypothetical protein